MRQLRREVTLPERGTSVERRKIVMVNLKGKPAHRKSKSQVSLKLNSETLESLGKKKISRIVKRVSSHK